MLGTSYWQFFLLVVTTSIFFGLAMTAFLFWLIIKKRQTYITLTDEKIADEIITLRTSIKTIYFVGPIFAILLAIMGLRNWEEATRLGPAQIKEAKEEFKQLSEQTGRLLNDLKDYKNLVLRSELAQFIRVPDFEARMVPYALRTELDAISGEIAKKVSNDELKVILKNYLTENDFNNRTIHFAKLADLNDKVTQGGLTEALTQYLKVSDFENRIRNYAKISDLATPTDIDEAFSAYVQSTQFEMSIENYVRKIIRRENFTGN